MPSFEDWSVAQQAGVGVYVALFVGITIFVVALVWFLIVWTRRGDKDEKADGSTK